MESSGPVFGRSPPDALWEVPPLVLLPPELLLPPVPPLAPPPEPATVSSREGLGLLDGVQVVVVPSALMVSVEAVKVTLPLFLGVYVPVRVLILMGVLAGMAASLAGPATATVPLSAPPSWMSALGFMAPLPSSTGLEETPFWKDMLRV